MKTSFENEMLVESIKKIVITHRSKYAESDRVKRKNAQQKTLYLARHL